MGRGLPVTLLPMGGQRPSPCGDLEEQAAVPSPSSTRWTQKTTAVTRSRKKDAPRIDWHKTEETGAHDREGYSRIPEDGTCNFTIQIDDKGYLEINGEKVVN